MYHQYKPRCYICAHSIGMLPYTIMFIQISWKKIYEIAKALSSTCTTGPTNNFAMQRNLTASLHADNTSFLIASLLCSLHCMVYVNNSACSTCLPPSEYRSSTTTNGARNSHSNISIKFLMATSEDSVPFSQQLKINSKWTVKFCRA